LFTSKDFPGSIPDHLVVSGDLLKKRPADVQKLINAWYMTLDYIKANPDKATAIMAKRAGVSAAEYKDYDAGTTIFSLQQNISAYEGGSNITHLNSAAKDIKKLMSNTKSIDKPIDLKALFDASFVLSYSKSKG